MKRHAVRLANALLAPLGARLVKNTSDFLMSSALDRLRGHGFRPRTIIDIGASDGSWSLEAMARLVSAMILDALVPPMFIHDGYA